jgi:hypothetical protein
LLSHMHISVQQYTDLPVGRLFNKMAFIYMDLPLVSCLKCLLENGFFACLGDVS